MTRKDFVSALRSLREDAVITKISDRARRIDIHFTEGDLNACLVIPKPPTPTTNERKQRLSAKP